jgi:acid phosphatase (class A)
MTLGAPIARAVHEMDYQDRKSAGFVTSSPASDCPPAHEAAISIGRRVDRRSALERGVMEDLSCRRILRLALIWTLICAVSGPVLAQPNIQDQISYLHHSAIGYVPPPAPDNHSKLGQADLATVKADQMVDEARRREAFEDAGAYGYDALLPRFSEAAGTALTLYTRPILAHMLKRLLADTGNYATDAKFPHTANDKRDRPYVDTPSIIPCETDFLYSTDQQSYPSGHATNGYAAALLISDAMSPKRSARRPLIMARGVRYGDNRIVCGVHFPSDVREGRTLAQKIYDKVNRDDEFRADLLCAQIEDERSPAAQSVDKPRPYPRDCEQRRGLDMAEATKQAVDSARATTSFAPN